jgi:hypothetical protein
MGLVVESTFPLRRCILDQKVVLSSAKTDGSSSKFAPKYHGPSLFGLGFAICGPYWVANTRNGRMASGACQDNNNR